MERLLSGELEKLVPSTQMVAHNHLLIPVSEDPTPPLASEDIPHMHMVHIYIYTWRQANIHAYKIKINESLRRIITSIHCHVFK